MGSMIFQDPFSSLNPRMTIFDNVGEPLLVNGLRERRARLERVAALLELTGLRPEYMHRFPPRLPRCPFVVDRCRTEAPALREVDGHLTRCHRTEELSLAGTPGHEARLPGPSIPPASTLHTPRG